MGCKKCTILRMNEEGCCTSMAVGGTKVLKKGERRIEVCAQLYFDMHEKSWRCGDYLNRPPQCRAFNCLRSLDAE